MPTKKLNKKLLFKLKILNRTYTVSDKDILEGRCLGETVAGKKAYINLSRKDNDSLTEYRQSLMHELFHAMINQFKETGTISEEQKADAFSEIMVANWKKLDKFMRGKIGKKR